VMLYRSKTDCDRCPVISIATFSLTPARTRFRAACGNEMGSQ
jgi:hypothetical protein